MPPARSTLEGQTLEGRWRLLRRLGEGGMGTVFLARDDSLDRDVAVKFLSAEQLADPIAAARFEREARVMAKLDHPNLVPIFAFGRHDGLPYLVMKRVKGERLDEWAGGRAVAPAQLTPVVQQLCAGLGHLHAAGILHRDIKPSNVLIGADGLVTLLDFGVARPATQRGVTPSGSVVGTPMYMAPEQILGNDTDHRVDLYALAVVLFELVTGGSLFSAPNDLGVLRAQVEDPIPDASLRNPEVSPPVAALLTKALAKKPEGRFASAEDFAAAWKSAAGEASRPRPQHTPVHVPVMPAAAGPSTMRIAADANTPIGSRRPSRSSLWVGVVLVLLGLAALAVGVIARRP